MSATTQLFGRECLIFLASSAACAAAGPSFVRWLRGARWLQPERHEDCPSLQKTQTGKSGTPTMGGLLVLGVAVAVAAFSGGFSSRSGWMIFAAVAGFGALGWVDDLLKFRGPNGRGLRTWPKLVASFGLGIVLAWGLYACADRPGYVDLPWNERGMSVGTAWIPFAALVMVGASHAVNLTDGMDGLAAGCLVVTLSAFLLGGFGGFAAFRGSPAAVWAAALAGACAGFLWINSYPASVFLGDVGAIGLGAGLGALSLAAEAPLWLLLLGGIFVAEALSVMAQVASFKWFGRRIFRVAPLHHHFQVGGIPESKLIVRFWLANLALVLAGLALKEMR